MTENLEKILNFGVELNKAYVWNTHILGRHVREKRTHMFYVFTRISGETNQLTNKYSETSSMVDQN